jgi:hypothetical protein
MKIKLMIFCSLTLFLFSCDDDNGNGADNSSNPNLTEPLNNNLPGDAWVITEFIDDDDNETNAFSGFTFTFDPDSTLTAFRAADSTTVSGVWFTLFDDGQTELWIEFPNSNDWRFEEIREDWYVISQSSDLIRLREDDDDNDDRLRFER